LKLDRKSMLLYAVTDRSWLNGRSLTSQIEQTLEGGATFIQLREKGLPFEEFLKEAIEVKKLTDKYNVPFVINDNADVAIQCKADGVHVGQSDMYSHDVRKKIGNDMILGVSAQTVEQAIEAEKNGADYIGVGAVFGTTTKLDADYVSYDTLYDICSKVSVPVVAIGGINEENILELKGSGICGVAVISAIFAQANIKEATKRLIKLSKEAVGI